MDDQIQNTRYCQLLGHEQNKASYMYVYKGGKQTQQWLCVDCVIQYFDKNGQSKLNHKIKQSLFLDFIKQQSQPIYHQRREEQKLIQICIKGLKQFIRSTLSLMQLLQDDVTTIDKNYNILEIEEIINITRKDQNLLKNEQIEKIINLNNFNKKYDYNLSSDLLKQLIQHYLGLQKLLQNKINLNKQNNVLTIKEENHFIKPIIMNDRSDQILGVSQKTINQKNDNFDIINKFKSVDNSNILKNRKYIIQEIDYTNNYFIGSSISKNEQYLAYGGYDKLLKIYDIKLKKIIKEIQFDWEINVCQFTQDSSQLYVGLSEGYMFGYDVLNDFKEIYQQQIHSNDIKEIITIQNQYLITCSSDQSIIKTDIKNKQQIFKLTGHTSYIIGIDYNDKDEIIVSGSGDGCIMLWDCRNQSIIINYQNFHNSKLRQIQFIDNNINILSLSKYGFLQKWFIDLKKKDLIKLQQFSDQNSIFNFYQVNQDQNLLLICNNYFKILNQQGETLNTLEHGIQNEFSHDCKQLDNLNYIKIRGNHKIILAIAQD